MQANKNLIRALIFSLVVLAVVTAQSGLCGECMENGVMCINEKQYFECTNGSVVGPIDSSDLKTCGTDFYCTPLPDPCERLVEPVCAGTCGECTLANGFACLAEDRYGFCYDQMYVDPASIKYCPPDHVCTTEGSNRCIEFDVGNPPFSCGISTTSTTTETTTTETTTFSSETTPTSTETTTFSSETTPTSTETTTFSSETTPTSTEIPTTTTTTETSTSATTEKPLEPNQFCELKGKPGKYRIEADTTCKMYIHCYKLAGELLGWRYVCAGYYNEITESCESERPASC